MHTSLHEYATAILSLHDIHQNASRVIRIYQSRQYLAIVLKIAIIYIKLFLYTHIHVSLTKENIFFQVWVSVCFFCMSLESCLLYCSLVEMSMLMMRYLILKEFVWDTHAHKPQIVIPPRFFLYFARKWFTWCKAKISNYFKYADAIEIAIEHYYVINVFRFRLYAYKCVIQWIDGVSQNNVERNGKTKSIERFWMEKVCSLFSFHLVHEWSNVRSI